MKKRVTLFCGHYGSGKTNVALNYALHLKQDGGDVTVADLDIVNPYFRTKDSAKEFEEAYSKAENRMIREFTINYCKEDGSIDWDTLIKFNSGD